MCFKVTPLLISFALFSLSFSGNAATEYGSDEFKSDLTSPFKKKKSKNILLWGSVITGSLILLREDLVNPLQEDIADDEPLGESSKYGDLLGRMIPNIFYMGYQWKFGDEKHSKRRVKYMFKTSVFAGGTTFFLKRLFNERRPDKGDRNSFPSGHTTTAFAFATVISLEHPKWSIPAHALATFVGLSRLNDNAHYLHDVTMGATIGMAYGYALYNSNEKKSSAQYMILPKSDGLSANYRRPF